MSDEVVTHAEVLRWLPLDIRRGLEMAMPPEQRGWFTEAEIERYEGPFVEVRSMSDRERRYFATGGTIVPLPMPTITNISPPTRAEIHAGVTPRPTRL
jgi:hypothetical protein